MFGSFNWVDLAVLFIIFVYGIDGLSKGLILSIFKTIGLFIAICGARVLAPMAAELIYGNDKISGSLHKYFDSKLAVNPSIAPVFNVIGFGKIKAGDALVSLFITIATFVIIFLLIKLALVLIANALDMTAKLPVVKQFNKIGGLGFGLLKGFLVLYIVFAVFILITPLFNKSDSIIKAINSSAVAFNFYKYNIFIQWLSNIFR